MKEKLPKFFQRVTGADMLRVCMKVPRQPGIDPTGSRARIKGEPLPEPPKASRAKQEPEPPRHLKSPLYSWSLSAAPASEAKAPLHGWALSKTRQRNPPKR